MQGGGGGGGGPCISQAASFHCSPPQPYSIRYSGLLGEGKGIHNCFSSRGVRAQRLTFLSGGSKHIPHLNSTPAGRPLPELLLKLCSATEDEEGGALKQRRMPQCPSTCT